MTSAASLQKARNRTLSAKEKGMKTKEFDIAGMLFLLLRKVYILIIGCIAGDDTIMCAVKTEKMVQNVIENLQNLILQIK